MKKFKAGDLVRATDEVDCGEDHPAGSLAIVTGVRDARKYLYDIQFFLTSRDNGQWRVAPSEIELVEPHE